MSRRQQRQLWRGTWGQFTHTQEQQPTRLQPSPPTRPQDSQEQVITTENRSRKIIAGEEENSHSALQQEHQKIQQANLINLIAAEKAKRDALKQSEALSRQILKAGFNTRKPKPKPAQSAPSPSAGFFKVDPPTQEEKKLAEQKPAETSLFWKMLGY